jgi:hypothetical protein
MKNLKLIAVLCCAIAVQTKAQFFGQLIYPFSTNDRYVSSAKVTSIHSSGFLTGMFSPTNVNSKAFFVRKTNLQGGWSSANDFEMYYEVYKDNSCSTYGTIVPDCYGMTVIETGNSSTPTTGSRYAMAAALGGPSSGHFCMFATLDQSGYIVNKAFYDFPSTVTSANRPVIIKASTPGYYICGSYVDVIASMPTSFTYIMKVSGTGAVMWSNTYFAGTNLQANDMIENPYNSAELMLVGEVFPDPLQPPFLNRANDGFFMKVQSNNGAVLTFKSYGDVVNNCHFFSCIAPAFSSQGGGQGVLVGGLSDPLWVHPANRPSWLLKLDPNGNIFWSTLVGNNQYNISSVLERQSPITGQYEIYACTGIANTSIYKLDGTGNLVTGANNFFDYTGITPGYTAQITCVNSSSPDDGLQLYSNDITPGTGNNYFVKAYFDGNSGCSENLTTATQSQGATDVIQPPITVGSGLIQGSCASFDIIYPISNYGNYNTLCSATSISGASNARSTGIAEQSKGEDLLQVQPNPTSGKTAIMFENGRAKIDLYNGLGQFIKTIYTSETTSQQHSVEFDFNSLNLESGIYFIHSTVNSTTTTQKVVYTK